MSGSLGNVIDRLVRNYVIDFLYFSLIDFPVFNLADCYVSVGVVLMVILLFTYYKDESFDALPKTELKSQAADDRQQTAIRI